MQNKLLKITGVLIVAISFLMASCSKEGPAGPAGAVGPAGPAGPIGPTGIANVKYSGWLNVTFAPNSDTSIWIGDINAPELVDSILSKGEMKVYWNSGSDSTGDKFVVSLPTYDVFLGVTINPYFSDTAILLAASDDVSSYKLGKYNYSQYRYVLIPGGVKTGGRYANVVDWNDYKAVKKYLGLKD
jgi:hypothetical protein